MEAENQSRHSKTALISWGFYDWANSSFSAIIQTFVFPAYFIHKMAANPADGSAWWGWANGLAAFIIAVCAPILGAIADQGKRRKPWIAFFTLVCIASTAAVAFLSPDERNALPVLFLVSIAIIGSETAFVFYNAMLVSLAGKEDVGRWSGWGWGFGYAGGLCSLIAVLFLFFEHDVSFFRLKTSVAVDERATFLFCALWYTLFSLPLFLFTPDAGKISKPIGVRVSTGWKQLVQTLKNVSCYGGLVRFFIARMFFIDGLTTLFVFGGIYASTVFKMSETGILLFGISLNVTAGIGAGLFALLDDRIGGKRLIILSLAALLSLAAVLLFATDVRLFWGLGLALGIFVGPVQSASRSYLSRLAPQHLRNEMFGFFALSGKATAFLGPTLTGWLIYATGSERVGMSVIALFFAVGLALMPTVPSDTEDFVH